MHEQDAEEWRIDCLLKEMNIHLPEIPLDENTTAEFPLLPVPKDQDLDELIDEINVPQPRGEAGP
jgi:hypothetical protein